MPISWALPVHNISFFLRTLTRSGGLSITGQEQIVQSNLETWRAKLTTNIRTPGHAIAYRSMMAQSLGRSGSWLIPVCAGFQTIGADGVAVGVPTMQRATFGDTATFSDGSVFETGLITGSLVADAAKGSRSVSLSMSTDRPLPGQYFSIGNYLYLVSGTTDASPFVVTFTPPLRTAVSIGDAVDFSRPKCLMRLASDDTGQMELESLRFATVSLDFVEIPPT